MTAIEDAAGRRSARESAMAAELLLLDQRDVRARAIEGDLVSRAQRGGFDDLGVTVARVLHPARDLDEHTLVLFRDRVLDRRELVLNRVADPERAVPARELDVDRHDGRLLDVTDDRGDDLEPRSPGLAHEDLTERVLLLVSHADVEVSLHGSVPLV